MEILRLELPVGSQLNKSGIAKLAVETINKMLERGNYFEVAEALSAMEHLVKEVRGNQTFTNAITDELRLNNGKINLPSGAVIEVIETAVKYDYSHNPQWVELDEQIKQLTEQKKKLEESLKRIGAGKLIVDEATGETFSGAAKSSKTSYKITLAR